MSDELLYGDLSAKIIGAGMKVLNVLKPGLDEKLYERALVIELRKQDLIVSTQRNFEVYYDGQFIGTLIPDLIVEEKIIVDTKTVSMFPEHATAQMIGYLNITGMKLGLLMNFKAAKLEWKRIIR